ncbi:MAG TPA: NAD+ kinase [Leptospiraceae bacterium]|nr:NAD+ kinase [Leptospiraceae bacterium]HNF13371.1 NAD+ kinase [Leptospiraceae bacterium]HNF25801.1 NAD+ kinase [Leptospiraceae bacterium]HNN04758.1 NAD+ kinase [Leptospiraceae bacterium]
MEIEKIVLVVRPTRLEENLRRHNTKLQAKFFIQSRGQSFEDYEKEDSNYHNSRDDISQYIPKGIKLQIIDRDFLPNFVFGPNDAVIALGQDGLVVNIAKYLNGQPIIAVNPDPERFDGILLPFQTQDIGNAIQSVLKDTAELKEITMAKASLNDGQELFAFNDFFIGPKTHTSARYMIRYRDYAERQSSSGVIISTPAGSTGWLSSVFNMAEGMMGTESGRKGGRRKNRAEQSRVMEWDEKKLIFAVREPFRSKWSEADLVTGEIQEEEELILESLMPESGVLFSDGMINDFIDFNSGSIVKISLAEKTTRLVV